MPGDGNKRPVCLATSGGFRIIGSSGEEVRFKLAKAAAVIAYLAFSDSQKATRDKLAGLLWSETDNTSARGSLRQCFYQSKEVLELLPAGLIATTKQSIEIDRSLVVSDLDLIIAAPVGGEVPDLSGLPDPSRLLEGFDDLDEAFGEWLREWREDISRKMQFWLNRLLKAPEIDDGSRRRVAEALNRFFPWHEPAARYLIEDEAGNENLSSLLRIYRRLWKAMDEEGAEEPSMELQDFVADTRMKLAAPSERRNRNGKGATAKATAGKRSVVTILAIRIQPGRGTALFDIEEFENLLDERLGQIRDILEQHGVLTLSGVGTELYAVFGYPVPAEDDTFKAISAAFEIMKLSKSGGDGDFGDNPVSTNIGIDAGTVYLRFRENENTPVLRDLFGIPASNAMELARLPGMSLVLATGKSTRRLDTRFEKAKLQSIGAIDVTNDAVSIQLAQGAKDPASEKFWSESSRLVGRTHYLDTLEKTWLDTRQKGLQFAVISGDPGIGKTRLVSEFLRKLKATGEQTSFVRCYSQDRSAPLEPMYELEAHLSEVFDEPSLMYKSPGDSAENGTGATSGLSDRVDASVLVARLVELLSRKRQLILLDDWQWADDASRNMLGRLSQQLEDQPILFVMTIRKDEMPDSLPNGIIRIELPNLTQAEVGKAANELLGWQPDKAMENFIYTMSGGNPLYMEEICFSIAGNPADGTTDNIADRISGSVQALTIYRLEQLERPAREMVEVAAIHGDGVSQSILEQVLGKPVDPENLRNIAEIGSFYPGRDQMQFYFRHGITWELIYNTIGMQRRRELHARFAEALEAKLGGNNPRLISEQLAWHYRGARNFEKAVYHAVAAGDRALKVSALDRAKSHFAKALEMLDQCEQTVENRRNWLEIAMRWGLPCIFAPSREQLPDLARAVRLAQDFEDVHSSAILNHWIGYITHVLGDHGDAVRKLTRAKKLADSVQNQQLATDIMATRGFANAARCDYDEAKKDLLSAIDIKNRNPGSEKNAPVLSSYTRATLAVIKADQGDFDGARELINEARQRVHKFNHEIESSICNLGAAIYLWQGRWDDAQVLAEKSVAISEVVSSPYLAGMARSLDNYCQWRRKRNPAAILALKNAVERLWNTGMHLYISFPYSWLADASFAIGDFRQAHEAASRALELAHQGDPVGAAMACRTLAAIATMDTSAGFATTMNHMENAEYFADLRQSPHETAVNHLHYARIRAAGGEPERACDHLDQAQTILRGQHMNWHLARANEMRSAIKNGQFGPGGIQLAHFGL